MSNGTTLPPVTLVLGGVRSGKSAYAERLVETAGGGVYLATARAGDAEMDARIRKHRKRRGLQWDTVEAPLAIRPAIEAATRPVLLDCVTLWLSNLIETEADGMEEVRALGRFLLAPPVPVVLVSNEVGLGGVPGHPLARSFADLQGAANQILGEVSRRVVLVAAGLPLTLKDTA